MIRIPDRDDASQRRFIYHMRLSSLLICLLMSALAPRAYAADSGSLRAGAAAVDISPQTLPALWNGGFIQKSGDRILDPLHARSLVLDDGTETIAMVIVDSCMFPTTLCDEIKRLAANETGIPVDRMLISATHTHSAPSAMSMCLGCEADEPYVKFVAGRVAAAIVEAHKKLRPAQLGWAVVAAADLTNCRRWLRRSDRMDTDPFGQKSVRAMMHPGYQNPDYTSPAGPIDPWLSVLSVVSENDQEPICLMANLSMHYFGGAAFSADYYGEVARQLELRLGAGKSSSAGFVGIMSQGTSGDLHWMDYSNPRQDITRQQYAKSVTDRILKAQAAIKHRSDLTLAMAEKRLTIDRRVPSLGRREWARPINAARLDQPPRTRPEVYAQQAEWIHEHPTAEVVLQAIRIGELGVTAIPNEVYGITGLKLKRRSPLATTFNLELANGAAGYIPPPEQHRLGGYTTWPARTAGLSEQAEPQIVETLLGLLESVAEHKRRSIPIFNSIYSNAIEGKDPIAHWPLDDMDSTEARDVVGEIDAQYQGGVALFLPGAEGTGMEATNEAGLANYGNRAVYLAGGYLEASLDRGLEEYSSVLCFSNSLPDDARDVTGLLLSTGNESLLIGGNSAGDSMGKLILQVGDQTFPGQTQLATQRWHQVAISRSEKRVRIFLDGNPEPEIDAALRTAKPIKRFLIGSDGTSDATFDGKIDEVALFDRALNAEEFAELYQRSGMTPPPRPKPAYVLGPKPSDADSRKKYADAVMASKPVAYWRLHDAPGASAEDTAGNSHAVYEQGSSPLHPRPDKPNLSGGRVKAQFQNLGNSYSVEFWFRNELPIHARPVTAYLFSRAPDGINGASGDNLGIGGNHSHRGRLIVFNGNEKQDLIAGQTRLSPGSWSHVVMVRQGERIAVYLNGDPEPEIESDLPIAYPDGCADFLLGGRSDNFANLQGMLEEVALYDRALRPEEVKSHFEAARVTPIKRSIDGSKGDVGDAPEPTDASKAIDTIHVRDGFEVQLVAAEPLVRDPVAIDWGPDGKLWVVEMSDYPLGVDGQGKPGGRVCYLEDTDGDGQYDVSTVFAEGLRFPNGILVWRDGILVTAAPEILYLADHSGDGKADVKRVLYSGFLEGNQQLRVNGLRWGLDNWIHCASGGHYSGYGKGSQIKSHVTDKMHLIGSRDFRIRPDFGEIDPQSGPSQYGRNRDDRGNWFGVQNSYPLWHYVLADQHIRRNPHFAPPDPRKVIITPMNPPVYPASKLQKRFHSFHQSGRFTSACSAMIYRDDLLFARGEEQHAFTCEPFHNLVQHNLLREDGVSFSYRRDPEEQEVDFFASEDRWCRPVMARTGPDGALWVVDMYRYMIEHPQWLPENGKNELRPWYRSGEDRGRIYRVVPKDSSNRRVPRLAGLTPAQLVSRLESPNGWQRDLVQRLLTDGDPRAAIEPLRRLASESKDPLARLHALCTLEGLHALTPETLESLLKDSDAGVRRHAVRIAARIRVDPAILASMIDDDDAKVLLQLATTLGSYDTSATHDSLANLLIRVKGDSYTTAAIMSSLTPKNVGAIARKVFDLTGEPGISGGFELLRQAVAMGNHQTIAEVIELVGSQSGGAPKEAVFGATATILEGFRDRALQMEELPEVVSEQLRMTISQARHVLKEEGEAASARLAAVQLLGFESDHLDDDLKILELMLVPQSSAVLQKSVVTHLSRLRSSQVPKVLLAGWRSHSPQLRHQIVDVLVSRKGWSDVLWEKLDAGTIGASELDAENRQRLLKLNADKMQWKKVLAIKATASRSDVLDRFSSVVDLVGDIDRGGLVFRKLCVNCHKLGDEGHDVGPQLASITDKSRAALLGSILDPNAAVDAKYFNYSVLTRDGRVLTGKLQTETGSSISLLAAEGKQQTILRRDIEQLKASNQSVMPEGLEQGLEPQDLADLIEFVRHRFR